MQSEFKSNFILGLSEYLIKRKKLIELENTIKSSKNTTTFFKNIATLELDFEELLEMSSNEELASKDIFKKIFLKNALSQLNYTAKRKWI